MIIKIEIEVLILHADQQFAPSFLTLLDNVHKKLMERKRKHMSQN